MNYLDDVSIAKIIRPVSLAILTLFFIIITILSMYGYTPDNSLVQILRDLLMLSYAFYFAGRSIEKAIKYYSLNNNKTKHMRRLNENQES